MMKVEEWNICPEEAEIAEKYFSSIHFEN